MSSGAQPMPNAELLARHETGIIIPGMVAAKSFDGSVRIANSIDRPIGFFNNWVGGSYDELRGDPNIGVWGLDGSVYELLIQNQSPLAQIDWLKIRPESHLFADRDGKVTPVPSLYSLGVLVSTTPHGIFVRSHSPRMMDPYTVGYFGVPRWDLRHNEDYK